MHGTRKLIQYYRLFRSGTINATSLSNFDMDLTGTQMNDGCFIPERCCLPTLFLPSQDALPGMAKTADIEVCFYPRAEEPTIEILQCAWKVLLYRYIYTETVSFVVVTHSPLEEAPHRDNAFQGWKMQASLCQFHNVSLDTLVRTHSDADLPLSPHNFKDTQVNTAIQVCRSATHGGLGKQAQLKPGTTFSYEGVMYAVRPTPVFTNLSHALASHKWMEGRHHPFFCRPIIAFRDFLAQGYRQHVGYMLASGVVLWIGSISGSNLPLTSCSSISP